MASLIATVGWVASAAPAAHAHVQIRVPKQRYEEQKNGPCGRADGERTQNVCEYQPGATITLEWDETVEHPGHFRVAFDDDGVDDLVDPTDYDDFNGSPSILLDNIDDRDVRTSGDPRYAIQVTLPDVECDNCTLQLIQVMTDKMPWGPGGGNDIYYQCADLVLSRSAPAEPAPGCGGAAPGGSDAGPGEPDAGPSGGDDGSADGEADGSSDDGGCAAAGGSAGSAALLLLAAFLAITRRRRRA